MWFYQNDACINFVQINFENTNNSLNLPLSLITLILKYLI